MPSPVAGEPVDQCLHPRAAHVHGTRAAYVADRCRCPSCRQANRETAQSRRRAIAYGRWQPYVDAGPVRDHLQRLRQAGLGVERIIQLSGASSGTIRQLIYGNRRTGHAVRAVRPATAARLLALDPKKAVLAEGHLTDATGTRRRLQALIAAGWSLPHLAHQLDRPVHTLRASLQQPLIRASTAHRVADLYADLEIAVPPQFTPVQRREAALARALAAEQGWAPPLAWDDIDSDPGPAPMPDLREDPTDPRVPPQPSEDHPGRDPRPERSASLNLPDVDDVVVRRALSGRASGLNPSELITAIDRLTRQGRSVREISRILRIGQRTVSRRRSEILHLRTDSTGPTSRTQPTD